MRTTKGIPWRMGLRGVVAGALLVGMAVRAEAQTGLCSDETNCKVASDRPASILIYPKIQVDTSNGVDTIIQLTNAGDRRTVDVSCFYVNANGHCSNTGVRCRFNTDCPAPGVCEQGWDKRDFRLTLTKRQPISWKASEGANFLPCDESELQQTGNTCGRDDQGRPIFNLGNIPQVQEDPFIGELKCIQVDETDAPVDFNELKGEVTTVRTVPDSVDVSKYNAIGIQALPNRNDGNQVLCLGNVNDPDNCPNGAEYAGCPQTLIMDHFFDNADVAGSTVTSDLTLVPCAENFQTVGATLAARTTVQFLIFNEFEQRFSTSFRFSCFDERQLSDIDTRVGNPTDDLSSIFNFNVQGTLSGQTRIRAVGTSTEGRGIVGILEEFHDCSNGPNGRCTASINLREQGQRVLGDEIILQ